MKITLVNTFHETTAEMSFFTTSRDNLKFTGKQLRRLLSDVCHVDGCDCLRDLHVFVDGQTAAIKWIDIDADEEKPAIEIEFPTTGKS